MKTDGTLISIFGTGKSVERVQTTTSTCLPGHVCEKISYPDGSLLLTRCVQKGVSDGEERRLLYLVADSIYADVPTFCKPIKVSDVPKERSFKRRNKETSKNVERLFSVLQSRFEILR